MNEYGEMFYGTLPPDTQDFRQVLAGIGRTIRERAAATGQRFVESAREARALQDQAFGDPTNPLRITDERALARLTDMIMGGPLGFAPAGITKAISSNWKLPSNYDDVTKLRIPKEFGGLKTEDYLFHGGVTDKLKSAPITSFSKSPQEALEYTTVSGGNIAAIPKSALKIYEGGNEKLTKAIFDNDLEALKKAGYDGFDLRSVAPGGYREVMVWNLDKALDKAVYAPVGNVGGEIGITQPLKSLLD